MAARVAGVDHRTPAKRAEVDPDFAEQAKQAEEAALDLIESAAFKSAVYGDIEPVFQSGVKVGEKVKYSDRMRELLLKAGRPEKYRERLSVDSTTRSSVPLLTAEDRQQMVINLLPALGDYARFLKAKPVIEA